MDYPPAFVVPPTTSVAHRVAMLNELAVLGARHPKVRALAKSLVATNPQNPLQALLEGLHRYVRYAPDPDDGETELFQRAEYTLFVKHQGDCDDMSVAYNALVLASGFTGRVVWIEQSPEVPNNHVATQVCAPGPAPSNGFDYAVQVYVPDGPPACDARDHWIWVETTLQGALVGRHPYAEAERLGVIRPELWATGEVQAPRPAGQVAGSGGGVPTALAAVIALVVVGATVAGFIAVTSGAGLARRPRYKRGGL